MTDCPAPSPASHIARLDAQPPHVRQLVLELLDEMTSPLHPSEIEGALHRAGFTRSERRRMVMVLKRLPIIAMGAGEQ